MTEEQLRDSQCWVCVNKEYDVRHLPNGKAYRAYSCLFPNHRHIFGRVGQHGVVCLDYYDEVTE